MNVIEIFLPVFDNQGKLFSATLYKQVKRELLGKFAGFTAYTRSPVEGLWRRARHASRDTLIIYEVMVNRLDIVWWQQYRKKLEKRFRQESLVIRCFNVKVV